MDQAEAAERAARFERNRQIVEGKLSRTPELVSPEGGLFYTGDLNGDETRTDSSRGVVYGLRGKPGVPDGEREVSRWVVMNVKPAGSVNGIWWESDGPSAGEFFEGELHVILTDRAVRAASNDGTVEKYGKLDGPWVCFAFAIALHEVDWVTAGRRAVAFGRDEPAAVVAAKAYHRADSTWQYKVGLRNDNAQFATDLALGVASVQRNHADPTRQRRAEEILERGSKALPFDRRGRPPEIRFDR